MSKERYLDKRMNRRRFLGYVAGGVETGVGIAVLNLTDAPPVVGDTVVRIGVMTLASSAIDISDPIRIGIGFGILDELIEIVQRSANVNIHLKNPFTSKIQSLNRISKN